MRPRWRFEELVALFAGPLLDEPDLDLRSAPAEAPWPELAAVRPLGGAPVGRDRSAGDEGTTRRAKWLC